MSKWENEKMKNRFVRYVLIVLLCGIGHIGAFAYGYDQNARSDWGYQPVYNSGSTAPMYQFRTTSAYRNSFGDTESGSALLRASGPRRTSPFDWSEDDDPIGTVPDPVPVGDTPWFLMLLLAAGYIVFFSRKRRKA